LSIFGHPPDFSQVDEPHSILASLPLSVYITTNYDNFMVQALKQHNKEPVRDFCTWNKYLDILLSPVVPELDRVVFDTLPVIALLFFLLPVLYDFIDV